MGFFIALYGVDQLEGSQDFSTVGILDCLAGVAESVPGSEFAELVLDADPTHQTGPVLWAGQSFTWNFQPSYLQLQSRAMFWMADSLEVIRPEVMPW